MSNSKFAQSWNYRPVVPLKDSPFFCWPLDFSRMWAWVAARWLPFAQNSILIVLSTVCWFWFQPSMETAKEFSVGWIAQIYGRNFVLILATAGGLHWYFHKRRGQGNKLKYDPKEIAADGKNFTFGNQVHDNMFWTLGSGVIFWSGYEAFMFWAMANGYVPVLIPSEHPIWFAVLFLLTPIWISFHFYWVHRFLHWPPLYRLAHALHHRNTNVGPWSGLSMHPIEHLLYFSSILIHWVVAAHPIHILFHMQSQALTASTSHTGYECLLVNDKKQVALGTFHHQMHHRYFECNYGNLEMPLDKWFGSHHDGTDDAHVKMIKRRKARHG